MLAISRVGRGAELLDAEIVVVDEALEEVGVGGLGAHFDTAAHAVEGHRDHDVAGLPTDGAVLGVVGDRPNARLGLDEGLVAIRVVLGREIVNRGVLVEVVGGVGLALGDGAVADVVIGVGNFVCGNQFITDVVPVLLVVFGGSAAKEIIGVDVGGIGGVGDGGEEVAARFVCPCDHSLIGIGEFRLEVGACKVVPAEAVGFGNRAYGRSVGCHYFLRDTKT